MLNEKMYEISDVYFFYKYYKFKQRLLSIMHHNSQKKFLGLIQSGKIF